MTQQDPVALRKAGRRALKRLLKPVQGQLYFAQFLALLSSVLQWPHTLPWLSWATH